MTGSTEFWTLTYASSDGLDIGAESHAFWTEAEVTEDLRATMLADLAQIYEDDDPDYQQRVKEIKAMSLNDLALAYGNTEGEFVQTVSVTRHVLFEPDFSTVDKVEQFLTKEE